MAGMGHVEVTIADAAKRLYEDYAYGVGKLIEERDEARRQLAEAQKSAEFWEGICDVEIDMRVDADRDLAQAAEAVRGLIAFCRSEMKHSHSIPAIHRASYDSWCFLPSWLRREIEK